jgi:hypothetical protein
MNETASGQDIVIQREPEGRDRRTDQSCIGASLLGQQVKPNPTPNNGRGTRSRVARRQNEIAEINAIAEKSRRLEKLGRLDRMGIAFRLAMRNTFGG